MQAIENSSSCIIVNTNINDDDDLNYNYELKKPATINDVIAINNNECKFSSPIFLCILTYDFII